MSGTWNPLTMHSRGAGEAVSKFRDVGMVSYHDERNGEQLLSCGAAPILGNGAPETSVALLNARLAHSRQPQAMRSRLFQSVARNRKRDQISS